MPDLDDLFKLATPKYVYIRDAKLGLLKYSFMALIFFYVVIYEILYTCAHLKPYHAGGYGTITMEHPVKKCDKEGTCTNKYKNIADLKYCKASGKLERLLAKGSPRTDAEEDAEEDGVTSRRLGKGDKKKEDKEEGPQVGDWQTEPLECRYLDSDRLTLEQTPNQIFIPMKYVAHHQEMAGDCYDPVIGGKGHTVHKASDKYYDCKEAWVTKKTDEFFVADIGDFTLAFEHSFMAPDIGLAGVSTAYQGFFAACPDNHPKDVKTSCKLMKVPNTAGAVAPEDEKGLVEPEKFGVTSMTGTPDGQDAMTFADLLKLTPVAQKNKWQEDIPDLKLPDKFGHPEHSLREKGGMMMLSVNYDNTGYMRPGIPGLDLPSAALGAIKPITYSYRPYFVPSKENKKVEVLMASDSSKHRTVNIWYGVTVQMLFEGKIVVFSVSQLLHGFTTGLVLLSSATTIVIYLALYVLPHKEKYLLQMYQYTEDMTDYKKVKGAGKAQNALYHTGEKVLKANKDGKLEGPDLVDVITDYEIRLNRLDGTDPTMAFYDGAADPKANESPKDDKQAMRQRNMKAMTEFVSRNAGAE